MCAREKVEEAFWRTQQAAPPWPWPGSYSTGAKPWRLSEAVRSRRARRRPSISRERFGSIHFFKRPIPPESAPVVSPSSQARARPGIRIRLGKRCSSQPVWVGSSAKAARSRKYIPATWWFPPGEKHWHGATPTTVMTHIAIQETLDGKNVDWLEKVSEGQYRERSSQ
jgi:hypothetical protein